MLFILWLFFLTDNRSVIQTFTPTPNFICSPFFFRMDAIEKAITDIGHLPASREKEHDEEKRFLKKVMQYLLGTYINKMRHTECEGCVKSYPSQRDHSCLMEEADYHIDRHCQTSPRILMQVCLPSTGEHYHQWIGSSTKQHTPQNSTTVLSTSLTPSSMT